MFLKDWVDQTQKDHILYYSIYTECLEKSERQKVGSPGAQPHLQSLLVSKVQAPGGGTQGGGGGGAGTIHSTHMKRLCINNELDFGFRTFHVKN